MSPDSLLAVENRAVREGFASTSPRGLAHAWGRRVPSGVLRHATLDEGD